jgi:hypothetical protein
MNRINERARGVAGAGELRVSAGYGRHSTIPRSCGRCGWAGDDLDTRIIESWFPSISQLLRYLARRPDLLGVDRAEVSHGGISERL